MNKDIFLNCLAYTGVDTGTSVIGLYSFSSGLSGACFNQFYSTGYNYYNGLPFNSALPLIYNGTNHQPSGNFSFKDVYSINTTGFNDLTLLISMNYSGCLNTGNDNYIVFSTTSGINNSGISLGITPSNRLFLIAPEYFSTISKEITPNDFLFVGIRSNRFVNFGLFNIKDNFIYNKIYDNELENLKINNLYFGGVFSYPSNYTGYSGKLNEIYLFNRNANESFIKSCIECSYATGLDYNIVQQEYTGFSITGSYWTGIKETQITGFEKKLKDFIKIDGSTGYFYYDSGVSGSVQIYELLTPLIDKVSLTGYFTGIEPKIDVEKKYSQTKFDLFFDLGLQSGDVVEIYTYKEFNPNVNLEITNNIFPNSNNYVQLFGNGLAETKSGESQFFVDYYTGLNNQFNKISNFDESDILLYDLTTGNSITAVYGNQECVLGILPIPEVITIQSVKGNYFPANYNFIYDIYLNGKKLISGLNYKISGIYDELANDYYNNILLSGDNGFYQTNIGLDSQELKLIVAQKNYIKNLFQITGDTYYLTGLSGFSEQIWKNGIRQKNGIDYFVKNSCRFYTGEYLEPNYPFKVIDSTNLLINNFTTGPNYVYINAQNQINSLTKTLSNNPKKIFSNDDYIDYETQLSFPSCFFSGTGSNGNLYVTNVQSGTIKTGMFIVGNQILIGPQNTQITGFVEGEYGGTGWYKLNNIYDSFSNHFITGFVIPNFQRNTGCWVYPLGKELTCISPWNSHNLLEPNTRATTLITPQHVLSAHHFFPQIGSVVVFVDENNQIYKRTIVDFIHYKHVNDGKRFILNFPEHDLVILLLDYPLPENIKPCSIMPSNYIKYLNLNKSSNLKYGGSGFQHIDPETCGLFLDKQKQALVGNINFHLPLINNFKISQNMSVNLSVSSDLNQASLFENIIQGDSSSPIFFILNKKIYLLAIQSSGPLFREPLGELIKYFNSGIAILKNNNPEIAINNYSINEFSFNEFDMRNNYNISYFN